MGNFQPAWVNSAAPLVFVRLDGFWTEQACRCVCVSVSVGVCECVWVWVCVLGIFVVITNNCAFHPSVLTAFASHLLAGLVNNQSPFSQLTFVCLLPAFCSFACCSRWHDSSCLLINKGTLYLLQPFSLLPRAFCCSHFSCFFAYWLNGARLEYWLSQTMFLTYHYCPCFFLPHHHSCKYWCSSIFSCPYISPPSASLFHFLTCKSTTYNHFFSFLLLPLRNISPNHQYGQSQEFSIQKSWLNLPLLWESEIWDKITDLILKKTPFLFSIFFFLRK